MKLCYITKGLENLYEVMHSWSVAQYFNKCGIQVDIINLNETKADKKIRMIEKAKKLFVVKKEKNKRKEKYEAFVKNNLNVSEEEIKGIGIPNMKNVFGRLILIDGAEYSLSEDEDECGYVSSVMLLNQKDYLRFIKPVDEKKPYILTYIEAEDIYKTEYINHFITKWEKKQVVISDVPRNYVHAKPIEEPGPEDIISLIFHADGVITDSLIVLELALVFHKNFLYMNGGRGEGRAVLMLEQMNLFNHFVHDPSAKSLTIKYKNAPTKNLWIRTLNARKPVMKWVQKHFPKADIDKLDICECPTDITRTECYGCLACKEICPVNAITMIDDKEEFLYPFTDYHKCTQCGLCKKICIRNKPVYAVGEEFPKAVYAKNNDIETLYKSTSGAVFPELAKHIIEKKKGAVVGVRYGESVIDVRSDIAWTMEEAEAFYGSKYVKSSFDGIFPKIKRILDNDKYVLYSGLPCECAGLKAYLKKDYKKLLICEIICHSVPSPRIYRKYIKYLQGKRKSKVTKLVFRQKTETFPKMEITYRKGLIIQARYGKNNYFRAFHNDYMSRTSCSKCQFTYLNRAGDITIGDFWGVAAVFPDIPDKTGISCVLINNEKGLDIFNNISDKFEIREITVKQAFIKNHKKPKPLPPEREELFKLLDEGMQINDLLEKYNDLLIKQEIKELEDDPDTEVIQAAAADAVEEVLNESDVNDKSDEV